MWKKIIALPLSPLPSFTGRDCHCHSFSSCQWACSRSTLGHAGRADRRLIALHSWALNDRNHSNRQTWRHAHRQRHRQTDRQTDGLVTFAHQWAIIDEYIHHIIIIIIITMETAAAAAMGLSLCTAGGWCC